VSRLVERFIRRARVTYRAHLADRVDVLMALGDDAEFRTAWSTVGPVLTWNHRPSARRLWRLAKLGHAGTIVEIGSFAGNSTIYLAMAGGEVHAVDPHTPQSMRQLSGVIGAGAATVEKTAADARDPSVTFLGNLERFGVRERVVYHRASSLDVAAAWDGEPVRLLYVDGMHTYDAVRQDYEAWRPFLAHEHVVLFDDYLWADVQHAVDDLRAQAASRFFYVRGGQAILSTAPLPTRVVGLP
jgi:predicted O-methyltransferase YrrM